VELQINDVVGKEIRRSKMHGPEFRIDRRDLSGGVYLFKLFSEGKLLGTDKLIITY